MSLRLSNSSRLARLSTSLHSPVLMRGRINLNLKSPSELPATNPLVDVKIFEDGELATPEDMVISKAVAVLSSHWPRQSSH